MMASTIALFSSSRRDGNTGQLMDRIASQLSIEVVDLACYRVSSYDYEHRNRNDDFEPLMRRLSRHHQIIFATPIYWYAVSPAMKTFLDRISDFLELPDLLAEGRRLRGKTAYVVCTSVGDQPSAAFMQAFRETFDYLGMRFGGAVHVNCQGGYVPGAHDPEASKFAALVREEARRCGPTEDHYDGIDDSSGARPVCLAGDVVGPRSSQSSRALHGETGEVTPHPLPAPPPPTTVTDTELSQFRPTIPVR